MDADLLGDELVDLIRRPFLSYIAVCDVRCGDCRWNVSTVSGGRFLQPSLLRPLHVLMADGVVSFFAAQAAGFRTER